jgi:hypothetical protein
LISMMNLSRISLTKYLGCSFAHSCEAALELEANGHERTHTPPDLDPFAFLNCSLTLLHCNSRLRSVFVESDRLEGQKSQGAQCDNPPLNPSTAR